MAFKKKTKMERYYFFPLLNTSAFDQHMLFSSDFLNRFCYSALAWYSTLTPFTLQTVFLPSSAQCTCVQNCSEESFNVLGIFI